MTLSSDRPSLPEGVSVREGLVALDGEATALRGDLEQCFVRWATLAGAEQRTYPAVIEVRELAKLDYFRNFPHLAMLGSALASDALAEGALAGEEILDQICPEHLEPARYALPSAACFNVYLHLSGSTLGRSLYITTSANCFRREERFDGLRRLLGFRMREIVCIGNREATLAHLASFKGLIEVFAEALGLPVEFARGEDPFFDPSAGRGLMGQLFPTKEEVLCGDLAIASLNHHRNFFGERCEIQLAEGGFAFTSCVAFGLERWISALQSEFEEPCSELRGRVAAAARTTEMKGEQ